ncbi:MAG: hypothetical protein ACKE51_06165 [Methylococcaceae bacterium]
MSHFILRKTWVFLIIKIVEMPSSTEVSRAFRNESLEVAALTEGVET